jgi:hypothetical protein
MVFEFFIPVCFTTVMMLRDVSVPFSHNLTANVVDIPLADAPMAAYE